MAIKLKNNAVKSVIKLFYWRAFYFQRPSKNKDLSHE